MEIFRWYIKRPKVWMKDMGRPLYAALAAWAGKKEGVRWHQSRRTPMAQHIGDDNDQLYWQVALLDETAIACLGPVLSETRHVHVKGEDVPLTQAGHWAFSAETLIRHHFFDQAVGERWVLQHRSPTAFHRQGQSLILPQSDLLWPALARSWEVRFPTHPVMNSEQQVFDGMALYRHRLYSAAFRLKGQSLPGFMGESHWHCRSQSRARLLSFLAAWGTIGGVGVKTALGMGGLAVEAEHWTAFPPSATINTPQ